MALAPGLVPPHQGDERTLLLDYLNRQRELVFWKLEGLSDDAARVPSTPTGMTIHGIVRHLTNVERSWWRRHVAGEHALTFDWSDEDPDGEMRVPSEVRLVDLLADYRAEIVLCDAVIAVRELDAVSAVRDHSVRWVLLHLIEEIGRHLGHLDVLAELADGRAGEEPEGAPPPGI